MSERRHETESTYDHWRKSKSLPPAFDDPNSDWYVLERATWWMVEEIEGQGFRTPFGVKFLDCTDGKLIHEEQITVRNGEMEATTLFDAQRRTPVPFEGQLTDAKGREYRKTFTTERLITALRAGTHVLGDVELTTEDSPACKKILATILGLLEEAVIGNAEGPFLVELTLNDRRECHSVKTEIWRDEDGRFLIHGDPWRHYPSDQTSELTLTLTDGKLVCLTEILSPIN